MFLATQASVVVMYWLVAIAPNSRASLCMVITLKI